MRKIQAQEAEPVAVVHPMLKQHFIVSDKVVNYENLTAFEAVTMSAVFFLAVFAGVLTTTLS